MHDQPHMRQENDAVEPVADAERGKRVGVESPVDVVANDPAPAAHTPRPHPPVEEPEQQPDEHAPATEPDDGDFPSPGDAPRRPPRPGKSSR